MNARLLNNHLQLRRLSLMLILVAAQLGLLAIVASSADATAARWYLRNSNTGGVSDWAFNYGDWGGTMTPVTGDWDGSGNDTPGMFDTAGGSPANWHLRNSNTAGPADIFHEYGLASGKPVIKNWTCPGDQTNVYKDGAWYLRRPDGTTEVQHLGSSSYVPAIGSLGARSPFCFNEDLVVFNPSNAHWKYYAAGNNTTYNFYFGQPGDIGLIGDWDGDHFSEPGIYRPSTSQFHLSYDYTPPYSTDVIFSYGNPGAGWKPVVGDWNYDWVDTIGLVAPAP